MAGLNEVGKRGEMMRSLKNCPIKHKIMNTKMKKKRRITCLLGNLGRVLPTEIL
jgi:hypothetical protein